MTSFWASPQDLDCFVVDNNGFILISERPQEVRRSEAELEGRGRSHRPVTSTVKKAGSNNPCPETISRQSETIAGTERSQDPAFSPQMSSVLSPPLYWWGGSPRPSGFVCSLALGAHPRVLSPFPPPTTCSCLPPPPPTLVHSDIRRRAHRRGSSRTTKMFFLQL